MPGLLSTSSSITAIGARQDLSIRYTERLAEAGIEPSVGSVGDAYVNALAESVIGIYKTEVIPPVPIICETTSLLRLV